jgi:hypothetical protein
MRLLVLFLTLSLAMVSATTLLDPFHASSNCNYSTTRSINGDYSNCDVIGTMANYDIQRATVYFGSNNATVQLFLDSGAVQTTGSSLYLGGFHDANDDLVPGDLFFYDPALPYNPLDSSSSANLKFGVPLEDHGGFLAGNLYGIGGNVGTETAFAALNGSGDYYRRDMPVLMTGEPENTLGSGTVTVTNYLGGMNAQYEVTVSFSFGDDFKNLLNTGQIGLLFASADCANDVIQGIVPGAVPEPQPPVLIGFGLAMIAGVYAWRRRIGINPRG